MELFGLICGFPIALIIVSVYVFLCNQFIWSQERLFKFMFIASVLLLLNLGLEIVGLLTIGALEIQRVSGFYFYSLHIMLILTGVPALANVLAFMLPKDNALAMCLIIGTCSVFWLFLALLQIGVSEALFGIQ